MSDKAWAQTLSVFRRSLLTESTFRGVMEMKPILQGTEWEEAERTIVEESLRSKRME